MEFTRDILWYGRGGQGAFSAAKLLGAAWVHRGGGFQALAFPSFGPERRGAPVRAFTKLACSPVNDRSAIAEPDYIVCLDATLAGDLASVPLRPGGAFLCVDEELESLCTQALGRPIVNTALLALLASAMGDVTPADIERGIRATLPARIQDANIDLAASVFERAPELLPGALRGGAAGGDGSSSVGAHFQCARDTTGGSTGAGTACGGDPHA